MAAGLEDPFVARLSSNPHGQLQVDDGFLIALAKQGNPDAYDRLLTGVGVAVGPKDVIEWLWVKDFVDLLWEAQRLRRMRVALLTGARRQALHAVLETHDLPGFSGSTAPN